MLYIGKYKDLIKKGIRNLGLNISIDRFDYEKTVKGYFVPEDSWENVYPTILPQWDRSAREGKSDGIYTNSSPDKFKSHVETALNSIKDKQPEHQILFLKSWNEWAEGNYIEPDLKFGKKYIEALHDAIEK